MVLDGYTLADLVVVQSLVPGAYAGLPALIHGVATGDARAAAEALLATVPPPGPIGYGLTFGVFCREQVAATDPARVQAAARAALPGFSGEVLALPPQAPRVFDHCRMWGHGAADASVHEPACSAVPALLLTGTFDAVTPPRWAWRAAEGLSRARVPEFSGLGHSVVPASACARAILVDFLDRPDGGYDTTCLDRVPVPEFSSGLGAPDR